MKNTSFIIEEIFTPLSSIGVYRLFRNEPYLFFLDSAMDRQKLGRFSFLGFDPFLSMRSKNGRIRIECGGAAEELDGNPFCVIKDLLNRYKIEANDAPFPFIGGLAGYFSYDLCRHTEKLPSSALDDLDIPDCFVNFYDRVIAFDHLKDKAYIASCGFPEEPGAKRRKRAKERLYGIKRLIERAGAIPAGYDTAKTDFRSPSLTSNFTKEGYIAAIKRAKEYIASGDIYQVNLSQRFCAEPNVPPEALFEKLRAINPAPFSAYFDFGNIKIVSASPERFLCRKGRRIQTRPIKGTRPRGLSPLEDERLKTELLKSAKDRAEHVMIVDLERNDLGRICEYGSVLPTEFVILEEYSTVFHLVSTVSGILKRGVDAADCLMNCFPGGSVTGTPKIRSMEIIDELEPTKRSVYTGAVGYIGFNQNMDTSIVIRTFIIKDGRAYFQVGGGIVADSDPEMEYQETLDKAKALIQSLGIGDGSPCYNPFIYKELR